MVMFDGKTKPEEIIRLVYKKIDECGGLYKAFLVSEAGDPYSGCTILYSGPNGEFFKDEVGKPKKIIGTHIKNETRALDQLKEKAPPAAIINLSTIGKYLFVENDLYEWINEQHKDPVNGKIYYGEANEEITQVMTEVSALFIRTVHGAVETACCGAVRGRVFCATELRGMCDRDGIPFAIPDEAKILVDALCANDDITTINSVDIKHCRRYHAKGDYEGAYRLICLSELHSRLRHALKTGDADVYADYLDRKELYEYDQIHLGRVDAAHPLHKKHMRPEADRIAEKEALIAEFKASPAVAPAPTVPVFRGARSKARTYVPR